MKKTYSFYVTDRNFKYGNEWWEYSCPNLNIYTFVKILGGYFVDAPNWIKYGKNGKYFSYFEDSISSKIYKARFLNILFTMNIVKIKPHNW